MIRSDAGACLLCGYVLSHLTPPAVTAPVRQVAHPLSHQGAESHVDFTWMAQAELTHCIRMMSTGKDKEEEEIGRGDLVQDHKRRSGDQACSITK